MPLNQLRVVSWSKRFDEPIVLEDGTTLRTLQQAIQYLAKTVPKAEQKHEKVLNAADHLTRSAEQNYPMYFSSRDTAGDTPEQQARLQSGSQRPPLGQAKTEEGSMTGGLHR